MNRNVVQMQLIKHDTDDGLMGFDHSVLLGKTYRIDLNTKTLIKCYNKELNTYHNKVMAIDIDNGAYLPLECLEETI